MDDLIAELEDELDREHDVYLRVLDHVLQEADKVEDLVNSCHDQVDYTKEKWSTAHASVSQTLDKLDPMEAQKLLRSYSTCIVFL